MDDVVRRVRERSAPLPVADVRGVGPCADAPPPRVTRKGETSYPFGHLEIGWSMEVRRSKETVKSAIRRWRWTHKTQRFQVWALKDGWTKVKRIK